MPIAWKSVELFSDVSSANVQTAHDDYQFAWVDGKDNNIARRVVINSDREIVASAIGLLKPSKKPEFVGVKFSDQNDEGTAIKRGKILLACYTYVDEEEVESNPSPVAVIDTIAYMAKGYYTKDGENFFYPVPGGEYIYTDDMVGSIESFVLSVAIDSEFVKRINVYVSEADYVESVAPATAFRLTVSKQIAPGLSDTNITVAAVPGIIPVSYENDLAPKGDDITLIDGVTFVGNAVNSLGLAHIAEKVWSITLSNLNKFNYINRFVRLDLYDEAGDHPIGADTLAGLYWSAEASNMAYFRILDSDFTTPLDVYHYPLGSDVKIHKAVAIDAPGSVMATTTIGEGRSGVVVTASQAGAWGNAIDVEYVLGTTFGVITCSQESGQDERITLRTATGVYHVTMQLVKPGAYYPDISIVLTTTETYKHHIAITLATANLAGYPVSSTSGDLLDAILAAMSGGGAEIDDLRSILSDVETYPSTGEFNLDFVFTEGTELISFANNWTNAVIDGDSITVHLAYRTEDSKIISTARNVVNAINNNPDVAATATAAVLLEPGYGYVIVTGSPVPLIGGTGNTTVSPTRNITTRMLSWIRIPNLMAHSDKTIYLVKFTSEPTDMSGKFVELVSSGATEDQINVADFYKDIVPQNPISDQDVRIADRTNVPTELMLTDTELAQYYKINAANGFVNLFPNNAPTEKITVVTTAYDELCAQNGVIPAYGMDTWKTVIDGYNTDDEVEQIDTSVRSIRSGYTWSKMILYYPEYGLSSRNTAVAIRTSDDSTHYWEIKLQFIRSGNYAGSFAIEWAYRFGSTSKTTTLYPESLSLEFNEVAWDNEPEAHAILSWNQIVNTGDRVGSMIECTAAIMVNGYVGVATVTIPDALMDFTNFDTNMKMNIQKYDYPLTGDSDPQELLPRHYGIRFDNYLDEWAMLNLMRFMPYYPTDGIGAYDEFDANTAETPAISFVNKNCLIDTISINTENRPGRLQWGNFGAMPDINEYSLNEDIMRIVPVKSYQPTDEHNTILIITKNNTHRLALLGNTAQECSVIKELNGIGLISRSALCETHTGIAWISMTGIWLITQAGIANISSGIIDTTGIDTLVYDPERNWIWCRGDSTTTYVYQADEKVWWEYSGAVAPDDFMGCINSETGWISYTDNVIYKDSDTAHTTTYPTTIITRAIAMQRTIMGRIKAICDLITGTYKFIVRMYGQYYTSGVTRSVKYTGTNNARIAVPGSRADYLQLEITEVNNIIAIEIEERAGK